MDDRMTWLKEFPALSGEALSGLRRGIDGAFRQFTRDHGETLELLFLPLRDFLIGSERVLTQTPWPVVMAALAALAWLASRSWRITASVVLTLAAIGFFGMWEDTMKTMAIIFVATVVSLVVGLPIGILMSRSDRLQRVVTPMLDVMQDRKSTRLNSSHH